MKPAAQLTPEELFNLLAGIIKPEVDRVVKNQSKNLQGKKK